MAMVMVSQVFIVALFCVSFFFFRFVIDEPIKLAFFFFFPITTLAIWDSERELAVPGMY